MQEIAEVVEVEDSRAKVEFARSAACKKCGICYLAESGKMTLEVSNLAGAKPGDKVIVELASPALLKASFVVYIIPIIFLIGGYVVGSSLASFWTRADTQLVGIIFAFMFLGISLWVVNVIDKWAQKGRKFEPAVVKVVESGKLDRQGG